MVILADIMQDVTPAQYVVRSFELRNWPQAGGISPDRALASAPGLEILHHMLSHVVIFWIKPDAAADAADQLVAGCHQYLKDLPGVVNFHVGRMIPSHRPVVDQSYQVGLNVVFTDKAAEEAYQIHPAHLEFVEKVFKPLCERATIFDFA